MSTLFGEGFAKRRDANGAALSAFGMAQPQALAASSYREVRPGSGPVIFTIGYEKRDSDGLISCLRDAGVDVLVDVRERPFSRKVDFRRGPLQAACEQAGIEYEAWTALGSTGHQRDALRESGDFSVFRKRFRELVKRGRTEEIEALAELASNRQVALICYERCHDECHRSIVAEFVAALIDGAIVAIV